MNRKRDIDQALEYILKPVSDSESEEKPTLQPTQGDEIKDTNANINESSGDSENEETIPHLPDKTNESNHVFRLKSSKTHN